MCLCLLTSASLESNLTGLSLSRLISSMSPVAFTCTHIFRGSCFFLEAWLASDVAGLFPWNITKCLLTVLYRIRRQPKSYSISYTNWKQYLPFWKVGNHLQIFFVWLVFQTCLLVLNYQLQLSYQAWLSLTEEQSVLEYPMLPYQALPLFSLPISLLTELLVYSYESWTHMK